MPATSPSAPPAAFGSLAAALAAARAVGSFLTWENQPAFWAAWPAAVPVPDWHVAALFAERRLRARLTYCTTSRRVHLRPL